MLVPELPLILAHAAIFLVAVFAINRLVLQPYAGSHTGREQRVADTRATAQREDQLAAQQRAAYEAGLARAREQADAQRQEIRGAAQARQQQLVGEALSVAEQRQNEARQELSRDVNTARAALAAEARVLAREMATRVLGRAP